MIPLKNLSSIGSMRGWGPIQVVGVVTLLVALVSLGCGREAADATKAKGDEAKENK